MSNLWFNPYVFGVPSFTSVEYPPSALTSASTTLSLAAYGNGLYTVTASSFLNTGTQFNLWLAFDKVTNVPDSNCWVSGNQSYTGNTSPGNFQSGTYNSATYQTNIDGTIYYGEWLQIQLPAGNAIVATSYSITARDPAYPGQTPATWRIAGSNNGTSWTLIDAQSGYNSWTGYQTRTFSISSTPQPYQYYRITIQAVAGNIGSANTFATINELRIYGYGA